MNKVKLTKNAQKDLKNIPKEKLLAVLSKLGQLKNELRPHGCKKISGSINDWRVRIGQYRIIYEIDDETSTVFVYRIKHRKDAYKL